MNAREVKIQWLKKAWRWITPIIKKHSLGIFLCVLFSLLLFSIITDKIFDFRVLFDDFISLKNGLLSQTINKSIDIIMELNKFLLGFSTVLFAIQRWFYKKSSQNCMIKFFLLLGNFFLVVSFCFGYRAVYVTFNQISQNHIALTPGYSSIVRFIEFQFYSFIIATVLIFFSSILTVSENKENCNE